jgi:anti-sigma B factor antagonist
VATAFEIELAGADVNVVAVRGEHDLATAADLRTRLEAAAADGKSVVVDLTEATFIDSAVLRSLLAGRDAAAEAGARYVLALGDGTGHAVTRLFELTGLEERLTLVHGRDAAVAAAAGGAASPPGG